MARNCGFLLDPLVAEGIASLRKSLQRSCFASHFRINWKSSFVLLMRGAVVACRLEPNEDIAENRQNLIALTQKVFDAIVSSADKFPPQLRSMCHCLYQVLSKRFPQVPQHNIGAVGTVIFLRFINPAIVSPQEMGIVTKQVPTSVKRGLMLMSKILQNIANHVEFSKEQHMLPFNDFLRAHFEIGRRYNE